MGLQLNWNIIAELHNKKHIYVYQGQGNFIMYIIVLKYAIC